jgi:hypothetical protein
MIFKHKKKNIFIEILQDENPENPREWDNLDGEIKIYNDYLNGNVYSFSVYKNKKCKCCGDIKQEVIDSCGGIYGLDATKIIKEVGYNIKDFIEVKN